MRWAALEGGWRALGSRFAGVLGCLFAPGELERLEKQETLLFCCFVCKLRLLEMLAFATSGLPNVMLLLCEEPHRGECIGEEKHSCR